ncbi:MAG: hypothetical protein KME31_34400 [Tolypothrix carrinoi HA7290-LM1]|nr:hypothetical protein [Tolypothrix carrinoi HA7290-LM1]
MSDRLLFRGDERSPLFTGVRSLFIYWSAIALRMWGERSLFYRRLGSAIALGM